jgi:hypothetical protein
VRRLTLGLAVACACGQAPGAGADAGCHATYSGNRTAQVSAASCATISSGADGGLGTVLGLTLPATGADGVQLDVQIDLGASPGPGDVSSQLVASWSAIAIAAQNNCAYLAGSDSVPRGNFTLSLSSVAPAGAHGVLHVEEYVHAPPMVDCGAGDTESVDVTF